ncbi:MAG: biotin/lipoyl-containing protein [Marinilabiliaceae bacterium]
MKMLAKYGREQEEIKVIKREGPLLQVSIGGREYTLDVEKVEEGVYSVINNRKSHNMEIIKNEKKDIYTVNTRFKTFDIEIAPAGLSSGSSRKKAGQTEQITAPIPGKIVSVKTAEGDPVEEYQTLVILSAMKMENELKAPANGIVSKIHVKEGDVVKEGAVLAEVKEVT